MLLFELVGREDDIRLSPDCWAARFCLELTQLPFYSKLLHYNEIASIENGRFTTLPVLQVGDIYYDDATDIAKFVQMRFPEIPIYPPSRKNEVEEWVAKIASLRKPLQKISLLGLSKYVHPDDKEYFRQSHEARLGTTLEEFDAKTKGKRELELLVKDFHPQLKNHEYLGGDRPYFADFLLLGMFLWAKVGCSEDYLPPGDPLQKWFKMVKVFFPSSQGIAKQL